MMTWLCQFGLVSSSSHRRVGWSRWSHSDLSSSHDVVVASRWWFGEASLSVGHLVAFVSSDSWRW
ncbi:hypothetical protein ACXZ9C_11245 [Streptococcus agalactiae]